MNTLNLFPARAPIGIAQQDGAVLMTPEFARAMRALFDRVGGASGLDIDDFAILMASTAQVAALQAEVQDLQGQVNQLDVIRAELAEIRKALDGVEMQATFRDPFRVNWERPGAIGSLTPTSGTFTALTVKLDQTAATSITVSNAGTPGASTVMQFELAESLGSSRGWFRRYRDGTGLTELGFSADLNFLGGVGGTTASLMRLKSSGSLLIGTTTDGMTAGGSLAIAQDFAHRGSNLGVFNTTPTSKKTVTGSRGGNAALASLLTQLAAYGLLTDSSTA